MLQDIDKQVLRCGLIFGHPITDALHVVSLEDRVGVITEPRLQRFGFALGKRDTCAIHKGGVKDWRLEGR